MKKAELLMTKAWQKKSPLLTALAPLSVLYGTVGQLRKSLYYNGKFSQYYAPIPVLVVGNITMGGSGKTPLIIALVKYLQNKGIKVGVISRGYGRVGNEPALVQQDSTPQEVGDEPCLIVGETAVPMAVGGNRKAVIELLLEAFPNLQLIISDDGLQHYALYRDVEWIVVDSVRGFGNGKLFPQGFLREPLDRLNGATIIYHDPCHHRYGSNAKLMHLAPSALVPLLESASSKPLPAQTVYAVSGIGYPARFFKTLTDLGFKVVEKPFGDHHDFVLEELLEFDDLPIVTTSKDAVKLRTLAKVSPHAIFENIWILPVQAVLSKSVYDEMDKTLKLLNIY